MQNQSTNRGENSIEYIVKKGKEKIQVSGCKEINGDRLLFKSKKESADQKQIIFMILS